LRYRHVAATARRSLLVDVRAKDAAIVAERVRFAFEGTTHHSGENAFSATVSAGLAVSAAQFSDMPSLMISADRALYRAKKNGRNLVVEEQPADPSPAVLGSRSA
jgi:diguanylate cyclase (GGDEF)-like protein